MKLTDIDVSGYDTLFLDRDGVINRLRPNDYVKCWEEFEFLPGILDTLFLWSSQVKRIIVITNQRGVARGVMTEDALIMINEKMIKIIEDSGGRIDHIYYCTAMNDADPNRKPNIGMALQAKRDFPEIDFSRTLMIGDSESDMAFAKNVGIKGVLIK